MSTAELKDKIQQRLAQIEDEQFLEDIYNMVCEDEVPYLLSDEQKKRIELARQEIKDGKTIGNDEANRQAEEWLKK